MRFFAPQGQDAELMGVIFGMEESSEGPYKRKIRRIDSHCQYELMHFRLTSDEYRLSLQSVCNGFIVPFSTAVSGLCLHRSADSQSQNR